MSGFEFDGPAWPPGNERPAGVLPPSCLTLELSALEVNELIRHHDQLGAEDAADHEHEAELFHKARASYLRQRLEAVGLASSNTRPGGQSMSSFPGAMFNAEGVSLDATIPDLTEEKLDEYLHRSMVARDGAAPIAQVWLLSDDAEFAAVHPVILAEAVKLVLSGKAIVILGRRLEPAVDVRDGLLDALELHASPGDAAGHA